MMGTGLLVSSVIASMTAVGSPAVGLRWTGCDVSLASFMEAVAAAYEQKTGTKVHLTEGGATRGIVEVAAGRADVGGTCRHTLPKDEERGVKLVPVAWDALVLITHRSNPVGNLTLSQVRDIFTGRISNWKEVGGPDRAIQVLAREGKVSGVGRMARVLVFHNPDQDFTPTARLFKSSGPLEEAVEKEPWAIAFSGISSVRKRAVKILSLEGRDASYENVASGKYLLYRPLYLVMREDTASEVTRFIDFVLSQEGQRLIKLQGTVPLKEGSHLWARYSEQMRKAGLPGAAR